MIGPYELARPACQTNDSRPALAAYQLRPAHKASLRMFGAGPVGQRAGKVRGAELDGIDAGIDVITITARDGGREGRGMPRLDYVPATQ